MINSEIYEFIDVGLFYKKYLKKSLNTDFKHAYSVKIIKILRLCCHRMFATYTTKTIYQKIISQTW